MMWRELVACAKRGGSSETELRRKIDAGHTRLWPVEGGCFALDRAIDGACVVWLGVGQLEALMAAEMPIIEWAKAQGCNKVRIEGRKGWKRVFPHWQDMGLVDGVTVLERAI